MALDAGTRLGPYEIVSMIGAGGMGEVYQARDTRLNRTVAIKTLTQQFSDNADVKKRFEREAQAIAALNHPHICVLHDGETRGPEPRTSSPNLASSPDLASSPQPPAPSLQPPASIRYLVMEHLEGDTLASRLSKGPLPLDYHRRELERRAKEVRPR